MSTMTMTMIGMYNVDQTIFDNMILPDELDRELVINTILMRSGEFEVLYPDIDFMKYSIGAWSRKWNKTFVDWVKGKEATWNPIENYDRYEDSSDSYNKSGSGSSSETSSDTSSGTASGSDTFGGTGSNTNSVSAYDASTFQNSSKVDTTTSNSSTSSSTTSASNNGSKSITTNDSETSGNTHTSHIHGNIGVTQASDMLKAFYEISAWNIYEHIADVFTTEYCIPIY